MIKILVHFLCYVAHAANVTPMLLPDDEVRSGATRRAILSWKVRIRLINISIQPNSDSGDTDEWGWISIRTTMTNPGSLNTSNLIDGRFL